MATIYRTPPLQPVAVDDLTTFPSTDDCVLAVLADGGHRYPDGAGGWKTIDPLPDPHLPRTPELPLLADGVDFASWSAAYGPESIRPLTLAPKHLPLVDEAKHAVQRDQSALNFEAAIDAMADLDAVCLRVHYTHDLHADEDPRTVCVYDARTERFYLLTQTTAPRRVPVS